MPTEAPEAGVRPGPLDLVLPQGMTQPMQQTWTDESDAPLNLTGYQIRLMIKRKFTDTTPLLSVSTTTPGPGGSTIVITNPSGGIVDIKFTDEDTAALPVLPRTPVDRRGVWDMEFESPAGDVPLRLQGRVEVLPEAVR